MKKVITAIGNPRINEMLKTENEIDIIGNDIQYKEAIFEMLEKNKVDFLITNEKILESTNIEKEISKIRKLQKNIKIILLIKNKNKDKNINHEKIIKQKNIFEIIFDKKSNIKIIIEKINNIINNKFEKNNKIKNNELKNIKLINNKKINLKKEFIFINSNFYENKKINKNIFGEDTKIILIIDANISGIKKGKECIKKIINNTNIKQKNINIIINNYNNHSFDMYVFKECFRGTNVIGKIKTKNGRLL